MPIPHLRTTVSEKATISLVDSTEDHTKTRDRNLAKEKAAIAQA